MQNDFNGSRLENGAPCRSKILHGRIIIIIVAILEGRVILALRLPCCHLLRCHHGRVGHHGGVGSFVCVSVFLAEFDACVATRERTGERERADVFALSRVRPPPPGGVRSRAFAGPSAASGGVRSRAFGENAASPRKPRIFRGNQRAYDHRVQKTYEELVPIARAARVV